MASLERYRSYLQLIAEMQTAQALRGKVDVSGVVQQTIWEATCELGSDRATADEAIAAQLRKILLRNLTDEIRRITALKRDVRREQSLYASMEHSSEKILDMIGENNIASPSQQVMRFERVLRVSEELEKLPTDERVALVGRYLREQSLADIAASMNRTKPAVAGLLQRGLKRLRIRLESERTNN